MREHVEWAVFKPNTIATLIGNYYGTTSIGSADDGSNLPLNYADMSFSVDLSGGNGAINNGELNVIGLLGGLWSVTFDGNVQNGFANMTNIQHNESAITTFTADSAKSSIGGAFIGTGGTPDFVSGFVLQDNAGAFVQGMVLLSEIPST